MGYQVTETILDPHAEWNEPQDRRRWLMVATLRPGFALESPGHTFAGDLSAFLDAPSEQDRADAHRIAGSIAAFAATESAIVRWATVLDSRRSQLNPSECRRWFVRITR